MSELDAHVLAERIAAVERHLARVESRLASSADEFKPSSDASDAVILHLWQAVQIVIDLAISSCLKLNLSAPATYADAFRKLGEAGVIDGELSNRLIRAAGFRNVVAHAYEGIDLARIYQTAVSGPPDLRAFLFAISRKL